MTLNIDNQMLSPRFDNVGSGTSISVVTMSQVVLICYGG